MSRTSSSSRLNNVDFRVKLVRADPDAQAAYNDSLKMN